MAEVNVNITPGSGAGVDTFNVGSGAVGSGTEAIRQALVVADPTTLAAVARVLNAGPATTDYGLVARILEERAATGTSSSVAASATSVTILASNAARRGAIVYNDSATAYLYLGFFTPSSLTSFTAKVGPGETFVMRSPIYTGIITGIWDVASGNARVTELT